MSLTLEEARTLDVFAKLSTIAKTAAFLHKSSSAIVYALDAIESKVRLVNNRKIGLCVDDNGVAQQH